jgi:cytochrome c-type biogenesis protein CcmF
MVLTEIGAFAILFALAAHGYAVVASLVAARGHHPELHRSAVRSMHLGLVLLTVAAVALVNAFLSRDFGVEYVASYSSRDLPLFYTLSAFWAGQKGSLLLWAWVLAMFGSIVAVRHRKQSAGLLPYVLAVMGVVMLFFDGVLVFVTPPFERLGFMPLDGQGLNPMLQNPGMIFHPTTLYLGYIAFTVPFAFAIAALLTGRLDGEWIRATRSWTIFAWFFLTWGNLFGAQWAYVELGWGGFWMWDPVESASFMPWLTGTAFLHSVMIQEKRGMLKVWNLSLIIVTFALTLFGTFLTRSGILSSVHTFSQSSLGPLFLGFIGAVLVFGFGLLAHRAHLLRGTNDLDSVVSRESSFLLNNLLFVGAAFAVFLGTVFPLIAEAVKGTTLTVAAPYYNQVTIPIFLAILALAGICPLIAWRHASTRNLKRNFVGSASFGLLVGLGLFALGVRGFYALLSFSLSAFVLATIAREFYRGTRAIRTKSERGWSGSLVTLISRNRRRYGGYLIHVGVVLAFVGATGKAFVRETKVTLAVGESAEVGDYTLTFRGISQFQNLNRTGIAANIDVSRDGEAIGEILPQKRFYGNSEQPTTEPAIRSNLAEDLYAILVEYSDGRATFKFLVNPLMAWLWIGGLVLTAGTLVAMWPEGTGRRSTGRLARGAPVQRTEERHAEVV